MKHGGNKVSTCILGFGDIEHIPTGQRSSEPKMTANVSKMLRTKRKKCYQSR